MNRLIFTVFLLMLPGLAQATSLDDIYRDLVRSENQGYLPLFVKNRYAPEFLDEERLQNVPAPTVVKDEGEPILLTNERRARKEAIELEEKKWNDAIEAIKLNNVSPENLEVIETKVSENFPKAVEIYAWMNAKGVGVEKNLNKSFELYQKAALLGVPNSTKNAYEVYQTMKPEEKAQAKPLKIEEEF